METLNLSAVPLTDLEVVAVPTPEIEYDEQSDGALERVVYILTWFAEIEEDEKDKALTEIHDTDKCAICGHRLTHKGIVLQKSSGRYAPIGRDCAASIYGIGREKEFVELSKAKAQQAKRVSNRREWLAANPQHQDLILWADSKPSKFAADLVDKLEKYGHLSQAQVDALVKAKADLDARNASGIRAPEGKAEVAGKIISVRYEKSDFNEHGSFKGLIELTSGARVWGTIPGFSGITERETKHPDVWPVVGAEIKFKANFVVSNKDKTFGFFKNPRVSK